MAQVTNKIPAPVPEFIRPKEAAALLSCAESTLWRWNKGRPDFPKPRKLGHKCTVFSRAELLAYIESKTVVRP